MKKYKAYEYTGDTLIYDPVEVEAELARLKADVERYQRLHMAAEDHNHSLRARFDLLKAALRWSLENGALLMNGVLYTEMLDDSPTADIAAVIAEALEKSDD